MRIAEAEATRQGIAAPQFQIMTPAPIWYEAWMAKSFQYRRKPVAVLAVGFAEKE